MVSVNTSVAIDPGVPASAVLPAGSHPCHPRPAAPPRRARHAAAAAVLLVAVVAVPAASGVQEYSLLGALRERDMTPYHLTRLEMMPAASSSALGNAA
jgi:hypothetical protein